MKHRLSSTAFFISCLLAFGGVAQGQVTPERDGPRTIHISNMAETSNASVILTYDRRTPTGTTAEQEAAGAALVVQCRDGQVSLAGALSRVRAAELAQAPAGSVMKDGTLELEYRVGNGNWQPSRSRAGQSGERIMFSLPGPNLLGPLGGGQGVALRFKGASTPWLEFDAQDMVKAFAAVRYCRTAQQQRAVDAQATAQATQAQQPSNPLPTDTDWQKTSSSDVTYKRIWKDGVNSSTIQINVKFDSEQEAAAKRENLEGGWAMLILQCADGRVNGAILTTPFIFKSENLRWRLRGAGTWQNIKGAFVSDDNNLIALPGAPLQALGEGKTIAMATDKHFFHFMGEGIPQAMEAINFCR